MYHCDRRMRILRASVATALCAALLTTRAIAAPPTLQNILVTPTAASISVGQKQSFTATGAFSNGSKQVLGPAIRNIAAGGGNTCVLLTSGGVECWGVNEVGQLGDGTFAGSLVPRPVKGITNATAVTFSKHNPGFGCAVLEAARPSAGGTTPMANWATGVWVMVTFIHSPCDGSAVPRPSRPVENTLARYLRVVRFNVGG